MRNYSTLIYFVNNFQSETGLNQVNLVDTSINNFLEKKPVAENLPSDSVIENILNFARSYEAFETESAGYVEMNLN